MTSLDTHSTYYYNKLNAPSYHVPYLTGKSSSNQRWVKTFSNLFSWPLEIVTIRETDKCVSISHPFLLVADTVQPSELILVCGAGRDKDGEGTHQDGHAEARTNIQAAGKPCYQNFLLTACARFRSSWWCRCRLPRQTTTETKFLKRKPNRQ